MFTEKKSGKNPLSQEAQWSQSSFWSLFLKLCCSLLFSFVLLLSFCFSLPFWCFAECPCKSGFHSTYVYMPRKNSSQILLHRYLAELQHFCCYGALDQKHKWHIGPSIVPLCWSKFYLKFLFEIRIIMFACGTVTLAASASKPFYALFFFIYYYYSSCPNIQSHCTICLEILILMRAEVGRRRWQIEGFSVLNSAFASVFYVFQSPPLWSRYCKV